jgi:signal peptidase II
MSDRDEKESEAEASAEAPKRRRAPVRDEAEAPPDVAAPAAKAAPKPRVDYTFLAVTSAVFLAADLGTKWWATKTLTARADAIVILPKLLKFDLAHNRGGAWSLLAEQPASVRLPFFFAVSAAAAIFIISLYRKLEPRQKALKWALPLVLGGALGNLVDRIRFEHVVDFIDPYDYWPTFNVADIWIVAGVLLMAVDMFIPRSREERIAEARERRQKTEAEAVERRTEEAEEPGT